MARRCVILIAAALSLSACATSTRLSRSDPQRIAHRTYVVTGASSGFGRGVALKLGAMHANVVLAARRTDVLDEVARGVRAAGGAALVVTTDVAQPDAVARLAAAAVARFGRIDVWINNAGIGALGRFDTIPVADQARVIDVNVKGTLYGSHAALRRFRDQGFGTLVNIGSVESEVPLAYHATYSASKAAVLSLGRALNQELRLAGVGRQIRVATVMPWAADTPFFSQAANYSGHAGRMVMMDSPDQVVQAIVWVSVHPREELPVGWKAQGASTAHHLMPDLTEHIAANIAHDQQMVKGAPTPPTAGAIYRPMPGTTGVEGGIRARMKAEDADRKAASPR
ncbi:MAG TPA: SDR family NAD(P)-dependent oxidoreductase [Sphingomonas sp.]|jgi:short-subunit dehydrogenase|uniref:SDR family NAD(P)-dependent oxidoreductase n=1 Tax=Sphingomonas sp. TaxID=28214 RepID=UPI002ED8AFBF